MAWNQTGSLKGPKGDTGNAGAAGRGVASATINGSKQLVITYTDASTANLGVVVGAAGADGKSVTITGSVATASALPTGLNATTDVGKGYIAQDTGNLHIWGGSSWTNAGQVKGPKGDTGDKGDTGSQGLQGIPGNTGARGSKWFSGDGAPSASIPGSQAGDYYLDKLSGAFFELT